MAKTGKPNNGNGKDGATEFRARVTSTDDNNIRNWRLFRGIATQERLARMTITADPNGRGINRVSIIRLETGETPCNTKHLAILSRTLGVAPRDLIGTNPYNAGDIFALYAGLSERNKKTAMKLLAALKT